MVRNKPIDPEEAKKQRIDKRKQELDKSSKALVEKQAAIKNAIKENGNKARKRQENVIGKSVIVDVQNVAQAQIAERAGASCIRIMPSILAQTEGQVMPDSRLTKQILHAVIIPVMAPVRCGHIVEAQIMENIGVDVIDECIDVNAGLPFYNASLLGIPTCTAFNTNIDLVCALKSGKTLVRVQHNEYSGASASAGLSSVQKFANIFKALQNTLPADVAERDLVLTEMDADITTYDVLKTEKLKPNKLLAAGGIVRPMDAAVAMTNGSDGLIIDNSVFSYDNPRKRIATLIKATIAYKNPEELLHLGH